jgi:hypothetical protein
VFIVHTITYSTNKILSLHLKPNTSSGGSFGDFQSEPTKKLVSKGRIVLAKCSENGGE